ETGPASTVHNLLSGLDELNVQPEEVTYVILTHIHLDHAGAAGKLLEYLPVAELIVHPRGAPHLV
ncbi:MAG: MBL fold metallo-hydrolase, partial [Candidatus Korarchaeota archaeon]|nr:MBL fold metallo-hydrolase [Candidatus Korarchaeota archaeon]